MSAETGNRLAVAMTLADAWAMYARSSSCDPMTPAEVLAFADGADEHEWSVVENLAGRTRPASAETRAATLAVLKARAADVDGDPFASFAR